MNLLKNGRADGPRFMSEKKPSDSPGATPSLAILVSVWHGYRWIAPLTLKLLDRYWPDHPPVWFCGLGEAGGLPSLGLDPKVDCSNWSQVTLDGVKQMRQKGYDLLYLVAEEHVPLAPCHEEHLNSTLPRLIGELPAVYISLMGWDNRRFPSRSPLLGNARHKLKQLIGARDPRFHLHPALWRADALQACCELALRNPEKNGSAWHFEKINDRDREHHPQEWRSQCYQIHSASLRRDRPSVFRRAAETAEILLFRKLMALVPLIRPPQAAALYARTVGFDNVFCNGPYPMFFSGIMAKGRINPFFETHLRRSADGRMLLQEIRQAMPRG